MKRWVFLGWILCMVGWSAEGSAAAAGPLVELGRPGPWAGVSGLIAYGPRLYLVNSQIFVNHNAADVYSYHPGEGTLRFEQCLFSQDAGTPAIIDGLLYLDGHIARHAGKMTRAGSFLDSTLDRYGEIALLSGAAVLFHHSVATLLACLLSLGAGSVVSYTRAKAEALGLELTVGLMQRPERVVLFCLGTLWSTVLDPVLPVKLQGRHRLFAATLYVLALLTTITAGQRTAVGFGCCGRRNRRRPQRHRTLVGPLITPIWGEAGRSYPKDNPRTEN